ncbi:hypothetical protein MBEHAL_1912 [Halarchaeum acidiphilum MH1-52-1]|uniref:Uncharacterized protein n=1 Tax=Halarchaeum acidiphilum MH1-52-1 TaxID=1261545 RepID=U2YWH5_9EURY|nr:hypothetical protein [Halarchaeum acidiphilum]GAD53152.1 hypothetical protein MBEHAL_1912 [Halarchaeum acidiphilum MH1-52-1]
MCHTWEEVLDWEANERDGDPSAPETAETADTDPPSPASDGAA